MKEKIVHNLQWLPKAIIFMFTVYFLLYSFPNVETYINKAIPASWSLEYYSIEPVSKSFAIGEPIWFEGERFARKSLPAILTDTIYCIEEDRSRLLTEPYSVGFVYTKWVLKTSFPFWPYDDPYITVEERKNCFLNACQSFVYKWQPKSTCKKSWPFNIVK